MKKISAHPALNINVLLATWLIALCGCSEKEKQSPEQNVPRQLMVVTTTTQITDLVNQLVGDRCKVYPMMGPGVDPHLYKPTARDIMSLSSADAIIYHGLNLEGKLSSAFDKAGLTQGKTYAIHSVIDQKFLLPVEQNLGYFDPHLWFDPILWTECLHGLSKHLSLLLPNDSELIEARAKQVTLKYQIVQKFATTALAKIPVTQRKLITSHDAFQYLGEYFGLEVIALQGVSTSSEAGLGDRANLVDFIQDHQVPCIFIESSVNPKAIQEVAREAKVTIGKPLFSDALGSPSDTIIGPDGEVHSLASWSGMMIYNVRAIIEGLSQID